MTNSTTSFGVYEAMRILVPGLYFTTLSFFFYWGFLSRYIGEGLEAWPLVVLFLFGTVVSGLTMYAKETPKRRRAFLENQPSTYLLSKARTLPKNQPLDESEARRLYFYILNTFVPPAFHEKIFFFGTIYHIMILVRRTSFWFAVASTIALIFQVSTGIALSDQQALVSFAVLVWTIYLLNVRYNKADRKMQENYQDQIFWLDMNHDLVERLLRKRRTA